jgi:hypothetical protein
MRGSSWSTRGSAARCRTCSGQRGRRSVPGQWGARPARPQPGPRCTPPPRRLPGNMRHRRAVLGRHAIARARGRPRVRARVCQWRMVVHRDPGPPGVRHRRVGPAGHPRRPLPVGSAQPGFGRDAGHSPHPARSRGISTYLVSPRRTQRCRTADTAMRSRDMRHRRGGPGLPRPGRPGDQPGPARPSADRPDGPGGEGRRTRAHPARRVRDQPPPHDGTRLTHERVITLPIKPGT